MCNGTDDLIELAGSGDGSFLHDEFTQRSVVLWVKANDTNGTQIIYDEGGTWNGLGIRIANGQLESRALIEQTNNQNLNATFASTEWKHIALIFDNGSLEMYVDGNLVDNATASFASILSHSNNAGLGANNNGDVWGSSSVNTFNGTLDDVQIYDVALSDAHINTLMNDGGTYSQTYKKDMISKKAENKITTKPVIKIYPNPLSTNNLTIKHSGFSANSEINISIRDLSGRILFTKKTSSTKNSLILPAGSVLPKGLYLISIEAETKRITKAFVIIGK